MEQIRSKRLLMRPIGPRRGQCLGPVPLGFFEPYVQAQLDAAWAVYRELAETKSRPAG
jgi:hypothetical protein